MGAVVKPPLNLPTFVERFAPDVKVTTDGQKAGTVDNVK